MRVLFLSSIFCTRALKEYMQLKKAGFDVRVGYIKPSSLLKYAKNKAIKYEYSQTGVANIITRIKPDIVHCHNTPNAHAGWAASVFRGPVVFDLHDAVMNTRTKTGTYQLEGLQKCKYLLTVNDDYANQIKSSMNIKKKIYGVPSIYWIKSKQLPKLSKDGAPHLCFIGSMATDAVAKQWSRALMKMAEREKIHIHVHVNYFKKTVGRYNSKYFHHEPEIKFMDIPTVLSRYDAGIVPSRGGPNSLPNKFFDYINAGISVISEPGRKLITDLIDEHNIGIVKKIDAITHADAMSLVGSDTSGFMDNYQFKKITDIPPYDGSVRIRRQRWRGKRKQASKGKRKPRKGKKARTVHATHKIHIARKITPTKSTKNITKAKAKKYTTKKNIAMTKATSNRKMFITKDITKSTKNITKTKAKNYSVTNTSNKKNMIWLGKGTQKSLYNNRMQKKKKKKGT